MSKTKHLVAHNTNDGGEQMTFLYDLLLVLTPEQLVQCVQHTPASTSLPNIDETDTWKGLRLQDIPHIRWDFEAGTAVWRGIPFLVNECTPVPDLHLLMLKRENRREKLLEAALNLLPDGVQVYDPEANVQFFNHSFKNLLEIPASEPVEGKNILDIFNVDPEYSSTLAALNLHTSVHGRFDRYKSSTGKELLTVNDSHPVFEDGALLGCITVERDTKIIESRLNSYQDLQQIMFRHMSSSLEPSKNTRYTLHDLVGSDPMLTAAKNLAAKMAPKDINILIQGETGTGKEIFAQGIHHLSSRKNEKFVAINCAAFPESLIEGLLFGTTKGAFTGSTDKIGLIEEANHGTLFLDELNSMSLSMQAKLLRVLQEKTLRRVGGTKNIPVDVRVVSSCNEDAYALSESGTLRRDLFYRLASVVIEIPPLRERMDDIVQLTWHYIRRSQDLRSQPISEISPDFWETLRRHSWPGNVRELFHVLNYALNDCEENILHAENLPPPLSGRDIRNHVSHDNLNAAEPAEEKFLGGLSSIMKEYEYQVITEAYRLSGGNVRQAAALLKISRQNFQYYARKYSLGDR